MRSWLIYLAKPGNRRRLIRFYGQFLTEGDLCFDVGAHLGNRTIAFLDLGCKVIALEPQPRFAGFLKGKFRDTECKVLPEAVGSQIGTEIMHVSLANPTISTLSSRPWRDMMNAYERIPTIWDEEVEVRITTLDELIERFGLPKFIKLDIEGYEEEALKGLSQPVDLLSLEFIGRDADRTIRCVDLLNNLDSYEFNISYGESLNLEWPEWKGKAETIAVLEKFDSDVRSGDLYARRAD